MISDKGSLFNVKGSRFNGTGSSAEDGLAFQGKMRLLLRAAENLQGGTRRQYG
jgi:hypothetical protein